METTSHLYKELRLRGFFDVYWLEHFALAFYLRDKKLAWWAWMVLLRDPTYFQLMYPGFQITGREYVIDIRNAFTGQTRQEWLSDGGSHDELLRPELWVIDILSLQLAYPLLYVHDSAGCPDEFGPHRIVQQSQEQFERSVSEVSRELWMKQAKIQGLNPCIYSLLHEVVPLLPSR